MCTPGTPPAHLSQQKMTQTVATFSQFPSNWANNLLISNCEKDLAMIPTSVRYSNPQVWPELCTVSTSSLQRQENPLWTASDGLSTGLGHGRRHQGCALPYGLVGRKPNAGFLVSGTQGSLKEARIQHIPLQSL